MKDKVQEYIEHIESKKQHHLKIKAFDLEMDQLSLKYSIPRDDLQSLLCSVGFEMCIATYSGTDAEKKRAQLNLQLLITFLEGRVNKPST